MDAQLQPNETLLGVLPAFPGLFAKTSTLGDGACQGIPILSLAIIRKQSGESASHVFEGITEHGNTLARDLPGFIGYEWCSPVNSQNGSLEDQLLRYFNGESPPSKYQNGCDDSLSEIPNPLGNILDNLGIKAPNIKHPVRFNRDIVGMAKAILMAHSVLNFANTESYQNAAEVANDFTLISRLLDCAINKVLNTKPADNQEREVFKKKALQAAKIIAGYANGFSIYSTIESNSKRGR